MQLGSQYVFSPTPHKPLYRRGLPVLVCRRKPSLSEATKGDHEAPYQRWWGPDLENLLAMASPGFLEPKWLCWVGGSNGDPDLNGIQNPNSRPEVGEPLPKAYQASLCPFQKTLFSWCLCLHLCRLEVEHSCGSVRPRALAGWLQGKGSSEEHEATVGAHNQVRRGYGEGG